MVTQPSGQGHLINDEGQPLLSADFQESQYAKCHSPNGKHFACGQVRPVHEFHIKSDRRRLRRRNHQPTCRYCRFMEQRLQDALTAVWLGMSEKEIARLNLTKKRFREITQRHLVAKLNEHHQNDIGAVTLEMLASEARRYWRQKKARYLYIMCRKQPQRFGYILDHNFGFKVGITENVKRRQKEHEADFVVAVWKFQDSGEAQEVETRVVNRRFSERSDGEHVFASFDEIVSYIDAIAHRGERMSNLETMPRDTAFNAMSENFRLHPRGESTEVLA